MKILEWVQRNEIIFSQFVIDHCGLHKLREILEFFFFFLFSFNRQFFLKVKLC